ncbi:hypothetical protein Vadar_006030 [Vaccinium darrowii]|uniref:Uncharacterized protein n=1 Tax=Vaccinium darrowii TaxID=229202 RepID=A0ACB7Z211_9ERIC|nr:hypothetical protein Vadar_006030 [Vaccinium darrowii]
MEDEALCRSWLAISQDPISGNSQTMTVFWERIRQCFSSQPNVEVNRMAISLSYRWSVIQKAVNKFAGFVDQVERRNQSGMGDADKIGEAKKMYTRIQSKGQPKYFTFDASWEILRHSCKWNEIMTKAPQKKSTTQTSTSSPYTSTAPIPIDVDLGQQTSPEGPKCPRGTKGEKEKVKKKATTDVTYDEMAANQAQIVDVLLGLSSRSIEREQQKVVDRQKKDEARQMQLHYLAMRHERKQKKEDHTIMSMDMSTLNPTQKSYYEGLQREIIAQRDFNE